MRSPTVQDSDLSTRTKIREAALGLFGTVGFTVSVRVIANAAGCSPGLVIHHFGNKDGLREAVDQSVMGALLERFGAIPSELAADELSRTMGDAFSEVIGASPAVRQYMRRSLLEATPASQTIFDESVFEPVESGTSLAPAPDVCFAISGSRRLTSGQPSTLPTTCGRFWPSSKT